MHFTSVLYALDHSLVSARRCITLLGSSWCPIFALNRKADILTVLDRDIQRPNGTGDGWEAVETYIYKIFLGIGLRAFPLGMP